MFLRDGKSFVSEEQANCLLRDFVDEQILRKGMPETMWVPLDTGINLHAFIVTGTTSNFHSHLIELRGQSRHRPGKANAGRVG